jgi:hypothetical protein
MGMTDAEVVGWMRQLAGVAEHDNERLLWLRGAEAIEEVARLRDALVKVVAHTGYIPGAERDLLVGLLASIDRIARAALSGERKGE